LHDFPAGYIHEFILQITAVVSTTLNHPYQKNYLFDRFFSNFAFSIEQYINILLF